MSDDTPFRRSLRASHCSQATSSPRNRHDHKKEDGGGEAPLLQLEWKRRPKSVSFRDTVTQVTDDKGLKSSTWDSFKVLGSEFVEHEASEPCRLQSQSPAGKLFASEDQPHLDIHATGSDVGRSCEKKRGFWGKLKRLFQQTRSPLQLSDRARNRDTFTYVCTSSRMMHHSHGGDTGFVVMF